MIATNVQQGVTEVTSNVGTTDFVFRMLLGLALLSLVVLLEGNLRWIGLLGLVPIFTGLFRFCPLYTVLGIRTCRA